MIKLCLVLILSASVFSESVRETETWMPMKTTQSVVSTMGGDLVSSGDAQNGSDFGFTDDTDDDNDYYNDGGDDDDDGYYDDDDYTDSSGSGDGATTVSTRKDHVNPTDMPDVNDNKIPEAEQPVRPTVNEVDIVQKSNEIPLPRSENQPEEYPANVLMAHASDDSIFNKTEVLAALIAGGAVGLMFAILLILLLIYRMKKKDEGSYDLGKKPIYKKAPTTEIYA
ncbi:syndecan-4 [Thalassophryne amazonica]|uniref:syndecan-4 n=1 Tax=Thalassophryne amazonica TaxID=390379 RepID=UPI001471BB2D|nr:syndecan-4 [Thalassophryne amazonica]